MVEASVLIPSYNNREQLLVCLRHLSRQSFPSERYEVVVVLDGSTDGSLQALQALDLPLQLQVITQANAGRAAALNRAAGAARGHWLIVTDADVVVNEEFVRSHVEAHERADVVIGPIPLSEQSPRNFLTDGVRRWAEAHERAMAERSGGFSCAEIYGANLSISRGNFEAIGGYRTDLRRTEDFQLGKKILEAGYSVAFCPQARATQTYDKTIAEWCHDFYVDGVSHAKFAEEFPDEIPNLKLGRFHPQTPTKRLLRPLVIGNSWPGRFVVALSKLLLERARVAGLRWRLFSAWKGVIGDALFWKGVRDELGPRRFAELVAAPRNVD